MHPRLLAFLLVLPLLAGCSVYHPLRGGVGFSEVPLGPDVLQVTYTGQGAMAVAEARQYALTRAAELAVLRDRPFFEILDERIVIGYGTSYTPPTYYPGYAGYRRGGRWGGRGYYGGYYGGYYEPGYAQTYTIPEVTLQVRLASPDTPNVIPAAYILRQARKRNVDLSAGVEERLAALPPIAGNVTIPPAPQPTERPAPATPR